ncbi:hypothetical protein KM043_013247 [Ampulex compressa]|nr:hypothetical protein KM043_013247 [Ampulex compressa]
MQALGKVGRFAGSLPQPLHSPAQSRETRRGNRVEHSAAGRIHPVLCRQSTDPHEEVWWDDRATAVHPDLGMLAIFSGGRPITTDKLLACAVEHEMPLGIRATRAKLGQGDTAGAAGSAATNSTHADAPTNFSAPIAAPRSSRAPGAHANNRRETTDKPDQKATSGRPNNQCPATPEGNPRVRPTPGPGTPATGTPQRMRPPLPLSSRSELQGPFPLSAEKSPPQPLPPTTRSWRP